MNFFQKIIAVWQKVNIVQRALLMAIVLTMAIIGSLLTYWARLPDMRVLYSELSPEEAAKVTDKISAKNVKYELRDGGRSIYVPKEMVYQLRLDLAKDGLPTGEPGGYKLFDNEKIGVSPFVQNVNLKRALQDELAKSIQMIEGVVHARIHIVSGDQTLFSSSAQQTSASIVLKLKPGYQLSGSNIAAIANLVAGSIEGLKTENVTIVDSEGRLLSSQSDSGLAGGGKTVQDYKDRVEQNLASKVEQMLQAVLGPGRATVRVSAEVNMTSASSVTESYSPTAKVPTKEEIKSNTEVEPASGTEGKAPATAGTKKEDTTVTEYVVGKTVEQRTNVPGDVMSLSVAAVVDLSPAAEANQPQGAEQNAKIMQLTDVEKLIETALGLDLKGRDSLKVVEAKFFRPAALPDEEKQPKRLDFVTIAGHASLGITALCALLVLRIFTKARKKAEAQTAAQLQAGAEAAGLLQGTATISAEPVVVRRQLAEVMRNNPDQARRLFVNWLQEKA